MCRGRQLGFLRWLRDTQVCGKLEVQVTYGRSEAIFYLLIIIIIYLFRMVQIE